MRAPLFLFLSLFLSSCATAAAVSGSQPIVIAQAPTAASTLQLPASSVQPPTSTLEPPTATPLSPTATLQPPTATNTFTPLPPSATSTPTDTTTPVTPSATRTASLTPSKTLTPTRTHTFTPTTTSTRTPTFTPTLTPTRTPTFTPSNTPTPTFTFTPSRTFTPTPTHTRAPSNTPDARIAGRATHTPYAPVFPTGDANKLRKPPPGVKNEPHLFFTRPIPNAAPSSQYRFGMTFDGKLAPHHGDDIGGGPGTAVGAAGAGTVFWAGDDLTQVFGTKNDFYGNLVVIQMNDPWNGHTLFTLYGHLSEVKVQVGQTVNTGDLVGLTGDTGVAYGPHLHFEVRQDDPFSYFGAVRNPELWVNPNPGASVIAGRVINSAGRFIPGARIFIQCRDALRFVDTYWDQGTPPDDVLLENFAISDIPNGNCNLETTLRGKLYRTSIYAEPGKVNFVIIQTDDK